MRIASLKDGRTHNLDMSRRSEGIGKHRSRRPLLESLRLVLVLQGWLSWPRAWSPWTLESGTGSSETLKLEVEHEYRGCEVVLFYCSAMFSYSFSLLV